MSASRAIRRRRGSGATLARLIAFAPPVAALIALETRAAGFWPLRFPRGPDDFERDPRRLFDLLTIPSRGLLSPIADRARARLVAQTRTRRLTTEPDKNRMTAGYDITIDEAGETRTVPVLTKFQSGRGMPLYMQAIRAVVEYRFAREIEFYRRIAAVVPIAVPRPIFADSVTLLNRVCLVLERGDGVTPVDWRGCPLPAMRALLAAAARLNATFLDRLDGEATSWIPARSGLEFAEFVTSFIGRAEPWYRNIWAALQRYFHERPVTLVHGDCRPGNMLFSAVHPEEAETNEDRVSTWFAHHGPDTGTVVMCDWEAVNVAPLLWDFTYCTVVGLRVADRRAWQVRLLEEFLDHLRQHGVDSDRLYVERAVVEMQLLAIVLAFISLVVIDNRLWSGQGNTPEDIAAWRRRVLDAGAGGDVGAMSTALGVAPGDLRRLQDYLLERIRVQ